MQTIPWGIPEETKVLKLKYTGIGKRLTLADINRIPPHLVALIIEDSLIEEFDTTYLETPLLEKLILDRNPIKIFNLTRTFPQIATISLRHTS